MRWPWDPPVLRRVVVQLKDDPTTALRGVLWSRGPWLTLRSPELLKTGMQPERLVGDAVIHSSNVSFLQVLP